MKHVLLTIFIWLQLSAVSASTLFYDNDLAGFELASSTSLTDFDSFLGSSTISDAKTKLEIDGNSYSNAGNVSGVQVCSALICKGNPFESALLYASGENGKLRIDLVEGVSAVGGIFGDLNGPAGKGRLSIFDSAGNLIESQDVAHGDMGFGLDKTFFGWTSDKATFSALEFMILGDGTGAGTMWAALDDLRFGSLALRADALALSNGVSAVPLPAAFWLFLTAISGLLGLNRLRRA